MLRLLLLLLDRQVAQLCKEEPPAQAGGFLFRTAMLRNRFPESPPASREGMAEMFTLQRLKLPPSLHKCLATTNLIESPQSGVARRTANVKFWRDQGMVERWVASDWLLTENRFRTISGHRDLWALATILGRKTETEISLGNPIEGGRESGMNAISVPG